MNKAEAIRNMRRSGMSVDDICRSLNATTRDDRRYVTAVLRKSGMQETEEEKKKANKGKLMILHILRNGQVIIFVRNLIKGLNMCQDT